MGPALRLVAGRGDPQREDLLVHAHYDTALTPPAAEVAAWTAAVLAGPDRVPLARVGVARRLSHAAGTSL
nr:hypothetical protein GCM10017745_50700 [Saccharothrix mutabilis subsp. capreolus]